MKVRTAPVLKAHTSAAQTTLLFARYTPTNLEPKNSIGTKWQRLLEALGLKSIVAKKRTAIKMHLGGGSGFTTIHPYFVRTLVQAVRAAGARDVFVCDSPGAVKAAAERGYTTETMGCQIVPVAGTTDKYVYRVPIEPPIKTLREIFVAGEIHDAEALIDLSHVKGHGDCGFGGASKNLSMGCVNGTTRRSLHALEGGLEWDARRCAHCDRCKDNCPNEAISFGEDGKFSVFYHHCKFCQHCVLICPRDGLKMVGGCYDEFQRGMATTSHKVLEGFQPQNLLFINFLMNITIYCDCWGMSSPALVPDIGILAGQNIVAIEQASLDLIDARKLLAGSLPPGFKRNKHGHLFEQVHGKDPYCVIRHLAALGLGSGRYKLKEIA